MSTSSHRKHPRLEELEGMVRDGRIDTLIVAFTDMQGRLMGKRVKARRSSTASSTTARTSARTCWARTWR